MAKRPPTKRAVASAAAAAAVRELERDEPRAPGDDVADAELDARARRIAAAIAGYESEDDEDAVTIEDLVASRSPVLLEELERLPPRVRAKLGFLFTVYDATRGPRGYMADSDWGDTVPTEKALAETYGPGVYVVRPTRSRKGKGGGNCSEIRVRVVARREPDEEGRSSSSFERAMVGRLLDSLDRRTDGELEATREAAELAGDGEIPKECPAWLARLLAQIEQIGAAKGGEGAGMLQALANLPPWLQQIAERWGAKVLLGDDAESAAAAQQGS